jgi:hypothetical protein
MACERDSNGDFGQDQSVGGKSHFTAVKYCSNPRRIDLGGDMCIAVYAVIPATAPGPFPLSSRTVLALPASPIFSRAVISWVFKRARTTKCYGTFNPTYIARIFMYRRKSGNTFAAPIVRQRFSIHSSATITAKNSCGTSIKPPWAGFPPFILIIEGSIPTRRAVPPLVRNRRMQTRHPPSKMLVPIRGVHTSKTLN